MGLIFYWNIIKHGYIFFHKFQKWAYISRKILKNRGFFLPKMTLKLLGISRLEWCTFVQTRSEYPPPLELMSHNTLQNICSLNCFWKEVSQDRWIWKGVGEMSGVDKMFSSSWARFYKNMLRTSPHIQFTLVSFCPQFFLWFPVSSAPHSRTLSMRDAISLCFPFIFFFQVLFFLLVVEIHIQVHVW